MQQKEKLLIAKTWKSKELEDYIRLHTPTPKKISFEGSHRKSGMIQQNSTNTKGAIRSGSLKLEEPQYYKVMGPLSMLGDLLVGSQMNEMIRLARHLLVWGWTASANI